MRNPTENLRLLSQLLDEENFEAFEDFTLCAFEDYPKSFAYRGFGKWKAGHYASAKRDFDISLAANPHARNTLFLRGRCCEELRQFEAAIADYNAVLRLDPLTADAHSHRGFCLEQLGRKAEAGLAYRKALSIDPAESLALAGIRAIDSV